MASKPVAPELRFWLKVNVNGPIPKDRPTLGPCWVWNGALSKGYGRFLGTERRVIQAHHFLWTKLHGEIPCGKELDHLCRSRACVRPSHLQAVTRQTNLLRGVGFPAIQAARVFCIHGHKLTGLNLYLHKGHRYCKTCRRRRLRQWAAQHSEV